MIITLGCDPEFVMTGKAPNGDVKVVKPENIPGWGERHLDDEIGRDGSAFELRPSPSTNPRVLVENLRQLLRNMASLLPYTLHFEWRAGSYVRGLSIGGHIHFGTPIRLDAVLALDVLLAPLVFMIEDRVEGKRRRQALYGHLGDTRTQPHGFEYRTSASWLWSPGIALAILALGQAIVEGSREQNLPWNTVTKLAKTYKVGGGLDLRAAEKNLPTLWRAVSDVKQVRMFYPEISRLKQLIDSKKTWDNGSDMKSRWGVV